VEVKTRSLWWVSDEEREREVDDVRSAPFARVGVTL
jgi:hypothetical protein